MCSVPKLGFCSKSVGYLIPGIVFDRCVNENVRIHEEGIIIALHNCQRGAVIRLPFQDVMEDR